MTGWCELCGCFSAIERHHVFGGRGRRQIAEKHKMVAYICTSCHRGPNGVHNCRETDLKLKREYQQLFEQKHTREEFMALFGRNYLTEEEGI